MKSGTANNQLSIEYLQLFLFVDATTLLAPVSFNSDIAISKLRNAWNNSVYTILIGCPIQNAVIDSAS